MTKVSLAPALKRWTIKELVLGPCPNISVSYLNMQLILYEINRVVECTFGVSIGSSHARYRNSDKDKRVRTAGFMVLSSG